MLRAQHIKHPMMKLSHFFLLTLFFFSKYYHIGRRVKKWTVPVDGVKAKYYGFSRSKVLYLHIISKADTLWLVETVQCHFIIIFFFDGP